MKKLINITLVSLGLLIAGSLMPNEPRMSKVWCKCPGEDTLYPSNAEAQAVCPDMSACITSKEEITEESARQAIEQA